MDISELDHHGMATANPPGLPPEAGGAPWGDAGQQAAALALCRAAVRAGASAPTQGLAARVAQRLGELQGEGAGAAAQLAAARRLCEAHWRRPVVADFVLRRLFASELFAACKALDLLAAGRTPQDVGEGFVRAVGDIGGRAVAARDVFYQRCRALGHGDGPRPTLVWVPGCDETGRHWAASVAALNARGHEVFVMDPMSAGQTREVDGAPTQGVLDSGFGFARDVAAVCHYAARQAAAQGAGVVVMGGGSGGAAIFLMLVAQASGRLPAAPEGLRGAVLHAPYLGPSRGLRNRALALLARLPGTAEMPGSGLWPAAAQVGLPQAVRAVADGREGVRTRLGALATLQDDVRTAWALVRRGHAPGLPVVALHGADDAWADPGASYRLRAPDVMGRRAAVRIAWSGDWGAPPYGVAGCVWGVERIVSASARGVAA